VHDLVVFVTSHREPISSDHRTLPPCSHRQRQTPRDTSGSPSTQNPVRHLCARNARDHLVYVATPAFAQCRCLPSSVRGALSTPAHAPRASRWTCHAQSSSLDRGPGYPRCVIRSHFRSTDALAIMLTGVATPPRDPSADQDPFPMFKSKVPSPRLSTVSLSAAPSEPHRPQPGSRTWSTRATEALTGQRY